MATLGDQGFTNGVRGLAAAAERRAPLVALVCNNGGSVSLRMQAAYAGSSTSSHGAIRYVASMSYAAIARGYGWDASVVEWPQSPNDTAALHAASGVLTHQLRGALLAGVPHLIEVVLPSDLEFWAGIWAVDGLERSAYEPTPEA